MPPLTLTASPEVPEKKALVIDRSEIFQEITGFGGAFTEAAAGNWRTLTESDQAEVIKRYFASPEEGGLGYTVGRVPINSCDFGPGEWWRTYSFDDVDGDVSLAHFDTTVSHDVSSGIIPMIQAAQAAIKGAGRGELTLFASPWSPPHWMKLPVADAWNASHLVRSMLRTALPNGLDPTMQRPYANYFSKFITAYKAHGIPIWGVTIQNEAEAADVGWEKCVWTPEFQAQFVKNHLGPVLQADHPGTKIIGFDHNKDHVVAWAKGLYADPEAAKYFDGIGVHWYGGLNTHNLDNAHAIAPGKFLLATEACNCPGVIYQDLEVEWWGRAEHLGMDILEDLLHWCTGWVDWNLILDTTGGPNHLGNRCDANIIADPKNKKGHGTLVMQASYYYMGHFSRFLPPGSKRVGIENSVVKQRELTAEDVVSGEPLVFLPCSGSELQSWTLDKTGSLFVEKTEFQCADVSNYGAGPRIDTYACAHSTNQMWERRINPHCTKAQVSAAGVACTIFVNPNSGKCLTRVSASGAAVGLDAGTTMVVAQALPCKEAGDPSQTFDVVQGDQQGFPLAFPIRSPAVDSEDDPDPTSERELCLQPYIAKEPSFDAVAFQTPDGAVSVIAVNKGDDDQTFSIYDATLGAGTEEQLVSPAHSIQSFRLPALPKDVKVKAAPAQESIKAPEEVMAPEEMMAAAEVMAPAGHVKAATATGAATAATDLHATGVSKAADTADAAMSDAALAPTAPAATATHTLSGATAATAAACFLFGGLAVMALTIGASSSSARPFTMRTAVAWGRKASALPSRLEQAEEEVDELGYVAFGRL